MTRIGIPNLKQFIEALTGIVLCAPLGLEADTGNTPPAWFPIYPSAEVKTEARSSAGGVRLTVIDLSSKDPCNTVADWYREKLKGAGFTFALDKVNEQNASGACDAKLHGYVGIGKNVVFESSSEPGSPTKAKITINEIPE
jgi:hypothetical protein